MSLQHKYQFVFVSSTIPISLAANRDMYPHEQDYQAIRYENRVQKTCEKRGHGGPTTRPMQRLRFLKWV